MGGLLPVPLAFGRGMIRGRVGPGRRAFVEIVLTGNQGQSLSIDAILDTGFEGYITLPPDVVSSISLATLAPSTYELADGQSVQFNTYLAMVSWHDRPRMVLALESNGVPLLGAAMLWGSRVTLDMEDGGGVSIEELSD